MIRIPLILAFFAALHWAWPSAASAETEETIISRNGLWVQAINVTEQGEMFCDVYQSNSHGFFQVASYGNEIIVRVTLYDREVYDEGMYDLRLNIDRKEWTLRDTDLEEDGSHAELYFVFKDNDAGFDFLKDMQAGSVITFPGFEGKDPRWSLSGSRKAIQDWAACVKKLTPTF